VSNQTQRPDPSQLLRKRLLEGRYPVEDAIALLVPIAALDERNDRWRSRMKAVLFPAIGLTLFLLFFRLFYLAVPVGAVAIGLGVFVWRTSRSDVPNEVRLLALPWLQILSADVRPEEEVALRIDLGQPMCAKSRVVDQRIGRLRKSEYVHPWFSGEALLADGALLRWEATTRIRKVVISKRSSSGRSKTKTKIKKWTKLDVSLGLPTRAFSVGEAAASGQEKMRVKTGEKRNVVRVSRVVCATSLDPVAVEELIQTVSLAYRRAVPKPATEQPT
jgi:hypothetical protein